MDALPDQQAAEGEGENGASSGPSLFKILGIGVIVLIIAWKFLPVGGDAPAPQPRQNNASSDERESSNRLENVSLSGEAAEQQRQLEIENMMRRVRDLEREARQQSEAAKREIQSTKNQLSREIQGVAESVERVMQERVRGDRLSGRGVQDTTIEGRGEFGDFGDFEDDGELDGEGQRAKEPEAFPFRPLGKAKRPPEGEEGANAEFTSLNRSSRQPEPAEAPAPSRDNDDDDLEEVEMTEIPAYSFTDLTLMHGVSCPVRTSLMEGAGIGAQPAPIVMPITGEFRGPQGKRVDIGRPHLLGFCEGVDRQRPTALIKVEGLSYVNADGSNLVVPVSGYVIDVRDNDLGVRGTKESVKGAQLALSVVANTASAVGNVFGQSAFDEVETQGGNIRSLLQPGQVGRAAAGSALQGASEELAQIFRKAAEERFDVIHAEGGTPVKFITEETIEIPRQSSEHEDRRNAKPLL